MPPILNGLLFGLVFVFAIGPSFFLLIQNSIEYGFKKGVFIAIGISLSDVLFVSLTLVGLATIFSNPDYTGAISVIAAAILGVFGLYSIFRKPVIHNEASLIKKQGVFRFIFKGFLFNVFNPTVAFFWITLSSTISTNYNYTWADKRNFFIGLLITIFSTDLVKAFMANHVRSFITLKAIRVFNQLVGSVLVLFALSLIYNMEF